MGISDAGCQRRILHGAPALLRPWCLRAGRSLLPLLLVGLLQRIEDATRGRWRYRCAAGGLGLRRCAGADDRARLAVVTRIPGQEQAGEEEARREDRGGPRQ